VVLGGHGVSVGSVRTIRARLNDAREALVSSTKGARHWPAIHRTLTGHSVGPCGRQSTSRILVPRNTRRTGFAGQEHPTMGRCWLHSPLISQRDDRALSGCSLRPP
jgi:hypothetical protein